MASELPPTEQLLLPPVEGGAVKACKTSSPSSSITMPKTRAQKGKDCLVNNLLIIFTVAGVLGGVVFGMILRSSTGGKWPARDIMYVDFVGQVFLSMLKSLILPLIVSSIVAAIGSLDLSLSGKIGGRAILYYMTTTISAIILGMILSSTIHPGRGDISALTRTGTSRNVTTPDTLMDLVRNMFPPNLVQACISQYRTVLKPPEVEENMLDANDTINNMTALIPDSVIDLGADAVTALSNDTASNNTPIADEIIKKLPLHTWEITHEFVSGMNIMGLVVFAVVLGITLSKMGPKGAPLLDFFTALGAAMMIITNWVIWVSPIGVFFLITGKVLEMDSFEVIVGQLGMYFVTVILGLFIHGFIILPLYYTICTKSIPFKFILNMSQALATAFGTGSSNATLPIAMGCLEDKNGIDPRVTRFVMPIGATINMDGTALYEAIAAVFISQVRGKYLSLGDLLAVSVTATAASIGAAGIPQAGLVTMVMVLDTVGLPAEDVTLIIAVDWLLDRFRTTINVLGDSLGAGIVAYLSRNELESLGPHADSLQEPTNGKSLSPEQVEWHTTAM